MGGTLGARSFPWPAAIGSSPLAQPLNQAQPVSKNVGQTQNPSVVPQSFQSIQSPTQPVTPPLSPAKSPMRSPLMLNPFRFGGM